MEQSDMERDEIRKRFEADPSDLDTALTLGQSYADLGWCNEAVDVYKEALTHHPDEYALILDYGNVSFKRNDYEVASKLFRKLTKMKPDRIEGWNNLGIVLLMMGKSEEARTAFSRVLEMEPQNPGALLNMGNYFDSKGENDKASECFEKAVEARPDFTDAWFNLGNTYLKLEKFSKARDAFEKALRYERAFPSALKNLGYAYEQLGDLTKAEELYMEASGLNKADSGILVNLANLHLRQKRPDEARKCFLRAVRLSPKDTSGWMGLRHIALLKGDIPTYVRATLAILPRLENDHLAKSIEILYELHQFDKAEEIMEQADKLNKGGDELDSQRLVLYQRRGIHQGRTTAVYKRLSTITTATDTVKKALARYCYTTGAYEAAIKQIEKISNPDIVCRVLLWRSYVRMGESEKTENDIRTFLNSYPDCFECWFLLAEINAMRKDQHEAKKCLVQAIQTGFADIDEILKNPYLSPIYRTLSDQKKPLN